MFIFAGEQGAQFPGAKWTLWDEGVHTAFIATWPGKIAPGTVTDALIQYEDVLPTFINLAGGAAVTELDGTSFLPVLTGQSVKHRQYAYGVHNNVPEGRPYPIRSIYDGRYRLIINLLSHTTYHERHVMDLDNGHYWKSWVTAAAGNPEAQAYVDRYLQRPAVELYDTTTDRIGIHNLAGQPDLAEVQANLTKELHRWMAQQQDAGIAVDVESAVSGKKTSEQ
jgi:arylsulfatase A-like enzyme